MPKGFFTTSERLDSKAPTSLIPKCGACGLYKTCKSPKMEPTGEGQRRVLILAEAPGEEEDERGVQLVGSSGRELMKVLERLGVKMRRDCVLTNALICRPPENAKPDPKQIEYCRPNLIKTLENVEPEIIIPLGQASVASLIGHLWKEDVGTMSRWAGWNIPCQRLNAWICPTYHPSYILRSKSTVLRDHWQHHLKRALKHERRPWDKLPDYESQIDLVYDVREAARIILKMIQKGGRVAFDYEANTLATTDRQFKIISASVCWEGKKTIAFPWHGEVIDAMYKLVRSDLQCIASNMKYEEKATKAVFGKGVKNWWWDTMVGAHVYDNRKHITGLKFQSFVWLGIEDYDDHIKPLLKAKKGSRMNQAASEIDLRRLLMYNGKDSLFEYQVCMKQRKAMGYAS